MSKNVISQSKDSSLSNSPKIHSSKVENSPFSQTQDSYSYKECKIPEENFISNFQEEFKPIIIQQNAIIWKNFDGLNNYQNCKSLEQIFDSTFTNSDIKMTKINSIKLNFLGKKRENYIIKDELFQSNKFGISNENSAFKKIKLEIKQSDDIYYKKNTSILTKKIKNYSPNMIIINETDNLDSLNNNTILEINAPSKKNIFKSTIYSQIGENNNENENTIKKTKRGRKPLTELRTKRVHDASDYDNILRKIQVHYLTFIISFINDLIDVFIPDYKELKFKNLSYDLKKTVSHSYVEELKNKTIGEILQFKASSKNRKFIDSINQQIYQKIYTSNPFLKQFFDMSYLDLFNNYYYKSNRNFIFEGIKVKISPKTKFFVDLLQKNYLVVDKIKHIAMTNFNQNDENTKNPFFVIKKKN
jgi:sRNA-binding carbon storage regulator CsrA